MIKLRKRLFPIIPLVTLSLAAAPETEYTFHESEDGSHPNDNEQQMTWLMNRARTNPIEEGKWLAGEILTLPSIVTQEFAFRGISAEVIKNEFKVIPPKQPAAFNRLLYEGSKTHSLFMISIDTQTHDGNGQFERLDEAGYERNGGAISVFWKSQDGVHAHAVLNIDWGYTGFIDEFGLQPGRGHRRSIHGDNINTSNVGIAMVEDDETQTQAGPLVTSIAYYNGKTWLPDHYNKFVVGTIWTDTNGNSQYDPGEGHGGVTVMPDIGQFWATTGDAGGFAIPATEEGTYNLTISGGAITEAQQRTVQVSNQSVLMLWNEVDKWPDPPTADPPLLQVARNGAINFSFDVKNGQSYQLRNTTDLSNFQNDERTISTNGNTRSFEVTQNDIDTGTFFDILVTVD